jgi:hypothetical protein
VTLEVQEQATRDSIKSSYIFMYQSEELTAKWIETDDEVSEVLEVPLVVVGGKKKK